LNVRTSGISGGENKGLTHLKTALIRERRKISNQKVKSGRGKWRLKNPHVRKKTFNLPDKKPRPKRWDIQGGAKINPVFQEKWGGGVAPKRRGKKSSILVVKFGAVFGGRKI